MQYAEMQKYCKCTCLSELHTSSLLRTTTEYRYTGVATPLHSATVGRRADEIGTERKNFDDKRRTAETQC